MSDVKKNVFWFIINYLKGNKYFFCKLLIINDNSFNSLLQIGIDDFW